MATATVKINKGEELVYIPATWMWQSKPETKTYTLTLSEEEAETLVALFAYVGGERGGKLAQSAKGALLGTGVRDLWSRGELTFTQSTYLKS